MSSHPNPASDSRQWLSFLRVTGWFVGGAIALLAGWFYGRYALLAALAGLSLSAFHLQRLQALVDTLLGIPGTRPGRQVVRSFLWNLVTVTLCLIALMVLSVTTGMAFFLGYASFVLAAMLLPVRFLFLKKRG
jgi:hypothetical protein